MGQYKVLYANSSDELETRLNEMSDEGWKPAVLAINEGLHGLVATAILERTPAHQRDVRYKDVSTADLMDARTRVRGNAGI